MQPSFRRCPSKTLLDKALSVSEEVFDRRICDLRFPQRVTVFTDAANGDALNMRRLVRPTPDLDPVSGVFDRPMTKHPVDAFQITSSDRQLAKVEHVALGHGGQRASPEIGMIIPGTDSGTVTRWQLVSPVDLRSTVAGSGC